MVVNINIPEGAAVKFTGAGAPATEVKAVAEAEVVQSIADAEAVKPKSRMSMVKESCTLVIVGAGYAGVCAFNAALQYLKPGDKVIIVDKGRKWGGQWVDQVIKKLDVVQNVVH